MKRFLAFVCLVTASSASADIYYSAVTSTTNPKGKPVMQMTVESWVDGENAEVHFQQSDNPLMAQGTYMVSNDGGRTLFLVNPDEQTYMEWDLEKMLGFAGDMMDGSGGVMKLEILDPKVEVQLEEPGESIVGLPTTHYRYRTSYTMKMKILGMGRKQDVDTVQDLWMTSALEEPGFGVWLRRQPPRMANEELQKLIDLHTVTMQGVVLRMVEENEQGRTEMKVTEFDRGASGPPSGYAVPDGYQLVASPFEGMAQMGNTSEQNEEAGEQEGGKKKKKGLLGRLKKKKADG